MRLGAIHNSCIVLLWMVELQTTEICLPPATPPGVLRASSLRAHGRSLGSGRRRQRRWGWELERWTSLQSHV